MSNSNQRWWNGNLASAVIAALVALAVPWVASEVLKAATTVDIPGWLVWATAAGILIVLSLTIPSLRTLIWGKVVTFLKWIITVRFTTLGRTAQAEAAADERGYNRASESIQSATASLKHKITMMESEQMRLEAELEKARADLDSAQVVLKNRGRGFASPLGQAPTVPLPAPRWNVRMHTGSLDRFYLANTVPGSVAKAVRIEPETGMTILDAGYWEDLSGNSKGGFQGELDSNGRSSGVKFEVTWFDENSLERAEYVYLKSASINAYPSVRE